jgi:surface antigen
VKPYKFILFFAFIALTAPLAPDAYAGPPPWAPAHGWRSKHDPYYIGYSGRQWGNDYGILGGRCNRQAIGTVLGGAVGGAIGSTVGRGEDRLVGIILGTVVGAVIGNQIGKGMDEADRGCIGHALELGTDRRTVRWVNPDNGWNYGVTPLKGFSRNGMQCREYRLDVNGRGMRESLIERACQTGGGAWRAFR